MLSSARLWLNRKLTRPLTLSLLNLAAAGVGRYSLDEEAAELFRRRGFHLLRPHFYLPIPDEADLGDEYWARQSELVGLDMNDEGALALLEDVFPRYNEEFRRIFPTHGPPGADGFHLINGSFMAVDAHAYYALIRHLRPRRVVEIGAGNSTLVASAACERNLREGGAAPQLTAIDPFPTPRLKAGVAHLSRLVEDKVQNVPMELFASLEANDILFIDSTHVMREGGDVQFEYCEVLPRLAPGVFVHVHDISLPKPYPRVYFERHLYWNEQYVLQTFLAFNSRFGVVWPGNYMMTKYPERVCAVFPEFHTMRAAYPLSEPTSFWMRA